MAVGTRKIFSPSYMEPGDSVTYNNPGTFVAPNRLRNLTVTGRGGTGNPGNAGNAGSAGKAGNPGNAGNPGTNGTGGSGNPGNDGNNGAGGNAGSGVVILRYKYQN